MSRAVNMRDGRVFLDRMAEAKSPWRRFAGLMLKPSLSDGEGLLFRPAQGIHTHFMRFAIDLVYLDEDDRVCAIRAAMRPWRFDFRSAAAVIEVKAGAALAASLRVGDQLLFEY